MKKRGGGVHIIPGKLYVEIFNIIPFFVTLKVDVEEAMYIAKELWHG